MFGGSKQEDRISLYQAALRLAEERIQELQEVIRILRQRIEDLEEQLEKIDRD